MNWFKGVPSIANFKHTILEFQKGFASYLPFTCVYKVEVILKDYPNKRVWPMYNNLLKVSIFITYERVRINYNSINVNII